MVDLKGREKTDHQLHRTARVSVVDWDQGCSSKKIRRVEGLNRLGLNGVFDQARWELNYALGTGRRTGIG